MDFPPSFQNACSFRLPEGLSLVNLAPLKRKFDRLAKELGKGSSIANLFSKEVDPSLTWAFFTWLRTITSLPIYVKVRNIIEQRRKVAFSIL
jgi:hypothetical protein